MTIDALVAVCPPPPDPRNARGDWAAVEAAIGPVPADYRALVATYGSGGFAGFLRVLTPFDSNRHLELIAAGRLTLEADRGSRAKFPDRFKLALHPEPGGLLPCAITDNGDGVYWVTEGSPDRWRIFVLPDRELTGERFDVDLTGFIADWLRGTFAPFGDDGFEPTFEPSRRS